MPEYRVDETVSGVCLGKILTKDGFEIVDTHNAIIESVEIEKSLGQGDNYIVADILVYINGRPLIIEIAVTHFIDDVKLEKIKSLNIDTIEINLSSMKRGASFDEIKKIVIYSLDHKEWVHIGETDARTALRERLTEDLRQEIAVKLEAERLRLEKEEKERLLTLANLEKLNSYNIEEKNETFIKELPNSHIWQVASKGIGYTLENCPDFLNHPVKGESIFACDRREWQAAIFNKFINNAIKKFQKQLCPISIRTIRDWCIDDLSLNEFGLPVFSNKVELKPDEVDRRELFNIDTALFEFLESLVDLGFLEYNNRDFLNRFYDIKIDTLEGYEVNNREKIAKLKKDNQDRLDKIKKEEKIIQFRLSNIKKIKNYNIKEQNEIFVKELPNSPIWIKASTEIGCSLENCPDFLNHPVKGENVFACDRRVWQAGLFNFFIHEQKNFISTEKLKDWCDKNMPLNRFSFSIWSKNVELLPNEIAYRELFNLEKSILDFVENLSEKCFLEYEYRYSDNYNRHYYIKINTLKEYYAIRKDIERKQVEIIELNKKEKLEISNRIKQDESQDDLWARRAMYNEGIAKSWSNQ